MGFWCGGSDGFVCLWLSSSGKETFFWTRPHMIRPAHAALISCLLRFIPPSHRTNVVQNVYFRAQGVGAGGVAHFTFQFIKQFVCDYVNVLRLTQATVWTSGVPPQLWSVTLSFTPVHVCIGQFWLLKHIVCECLHWNSSLTHTHTHASTNIDASFCNPGMALMLKVWWKEGKAEHAFGGPTQFSYCKQKNNAAAVNWSYNNVLEAHLSLIHRFRWSILIAFFRQWHTG